MLTEENLGQGTTTMAKDLLSLNGGVPLSVTRTVTELVCGVETWGAIQENRPAGEIVAPAGADGRVKVSVSAGMSESVAVLVKLRGEPALTVIVEMADNVGAVLV